MTFRKMASVFALAVAVLALQTGRCTADAGDPHETPAERDARMAWWRAARFGMFIHWNVSSVPAGVYHGKNNYFVGEWIMHDEKIPVAEYRSYAPQFNPVKFNAEEWVLLAKAAGMKYIVITAKHHDGFAMYHSKVSKWNIWDATPFKRDPLKELSEACKKHGIRLGFYYSHAQDWNHPGGAVPGGVWDAAQKGDMDEYLDTIAIPQLREILTGYGKVSILWFDSPYEITPERAARVHSVLALQPGIIINDRLGGGYEGDAASPEQDVPANGIPGRDFEACMTMNETWGYKSTDHEWKARGVLLHYLVDLASKGGNYLLNVGPNAEGEIPAPSVERLKQVGEWLAVNGASIYATSAGPFTQPLPWGRCTQKTTAQGTTLYLHVFDWPSDGQLVIPALTNDVEAAYLLADPDRHPLQTTGDTTGLTITVPAAAPDADVSVVALRLKGNASFREARADITDAAIKDGTHAASQWGSRMNLSYTAVTDAGLVYLAQYQKLSRLDLGYTRITDVGLKALQDLPQLDELNLIGTDITDTGLAHLKAVHNLRVLVLDGTKITDAGLVHLTGMSGLCDLYLRDTQVTDAGVAMLQNARPKVTIVR